MSFFPCHQTRRELVWQMGGGFTGVALAAQLQQDGFFSRVMADSGKPATEFGPLAPRPAHFPARARACIFLMMNGAPSQVDTFDYKPALEKYAGQPLPPGRSYINSGGRRVVFLTPAFRRFRPGGDSGLLISDYFPNVRQHADKLAVIRSCHTDSHAHGSALVAMNTGKTFIGRPSLGSWCVYGMGSENQSLPGYVVILDRRGGPISGQPNWSSGFMSAAYQGTLFRPAGNPILDLQGPQHITDDIQRSQLAMLRNLNERHMAARPGGSELAARITSYELAYRMQSAAPEAVDLTQETQQTLQQYGVGSEPTDEFGRNCLVARRLVERGVRFVQVWSGNDNSFPRRNWDSHEDIRQDHGALAAGFARGASALIEDLKQRGLLDDTIVLWTTEFGRMPSSQGGKGRDHNPYCFTNWLCGGGVRGGVTAGESDEWGYKPRDRANPTTVYDIHATILHLLGIDHTRLTFRHNGVDRRLTDVHGEVIRGILA